MSLGIKVWGTDAIKTSVANQEILPSPTEWSYAPARFTTFNFSNKQDCTITVNDSEPIFLEAYQGFSHTHTVKTVNSLKILESGIEYNYIGVLG